MTNGTVNAIACTADTIYLGGNFTYVGPCTGGGAPISASTGQVAAKLPKVIGNVYACVADGAGGWFIGGYFSKVGSVPRNSIAHILADGSLDPVWNPNASGGGYYGESSVNALTVSGSTVYAGGQFTSIGGLPRNNIAALDASTGNATPWNPNAIGGDPGTSVYALTVSGSTVYAGGYFTSIGGQTRNCIAALDASTGNATPWNPNASGNVSALAVSGSTVYAGGNFSSIGGQARNKIAALDASTGNATPWDPNPSGGHYFGSVYALAVSGSTVYAGGDFASIGGQTRNCIAALDASTGNATPWNPDPNASEAPPGVLTLAVPGDGNTVYVGGYFTSIGGQTRNHLAALDASTGNATPWNPNASASVFALAVTGSTVYAGGEFRSIGGQIRRGLAALDATTGNATPWNPDAGTGTNTSAEVEALAVSGTTVYAGGYFYGVDQQLRDNIAAIEATTGSVLQWNPSSNASVYALAVSGSTVYAGGAFTNIGGQMRVRLAALDASTGNATAWNPSASGWVNSVNALAVSNSTVYAGGSFTSIGGQTRNCIAALDVSTGNATPWNPNPDTGGVGSIHALAVSGSTVYAGGGFTSIGGQSRNHLAALDAATGNATPWNPKASGEVYALAVSGSTVYAGGRFTIIGGQTRNWIAALDVSTGDATPWNPNVSGLPMMDSGIHALAVSGSTVYAGGGFTSIGGQPRVGFAQFSIERPPSGVGHWHLFK